MRKIFLAFVAVCLLMLPVSAGAVKIINPPPSSVATTWGSITGTLASQTDLQSALDARCLESVFGTAIGTGLTLDSTTLKVSTVLQAYHAINPSTDVKSLLGCANEAAIRTLLDLEPGTDFYSKSAEDTWRSSVTQTEMGYLHGVSSSIQNQLDARCLESVFGTAIGTGLTLDSTTLKASSILQKYHGVDPSANVLSFLGAANYGAMLTLLQSTWDGRYYTETESDAAFQPLDSELTVWAGIKLKLDATAAPDADNDTDEGYVVGSTWWDVTNDRHYVCLDNTDGAAVWYETTQFDKATAGTDYDKPGTAPTSSQLLKAPTAFTANDATPSVAGGNNFYTANTEAKTITMFDGGTSGQWIHVEIRDAYTTIDFSGTNLIGNYGNDVTLDNGDWIWAKFDGTNWECWIYHDTIPLKEWAYAFGADALGNGVYMGKTASGRNAGEDIEQFELVRLDSANDEWMLADNTGVDTSTSPDTFKACEGVAVGCPGNDWPCQNGESIIVLLEGVYRYDTHNFTAKRPIYLSTSGTMTQTTPTGASGFHQEVGTALTDDEVRFKPKPIDWSVPRAGTTAVDKTLNAIEATNTVWTVTVAKTVTLPLVAEVPTISTTVIAVGAIEIHVDPNDADRLLNDGAANANGHKVTSTSTAGDQCTITYYDADGPIAQTNGWTQE